MEAPDPSAAVRSPHGDTGDAAGLPGASGKVRFAAPEDWEETRPSNAFTLASWSLPEGGACTVTAVGGGVEMNLNRWLGQFAPPEGESDLVSSQGPLEDARYPTTRMEIEGTMTATRSVGGGPPRKDWMLVGAALEDTPSGTVYVKIMGPKSTLEPQLDSLWEAVRGLEITP